jgi:multidrug efflux pump subunit AcrA (membrane-fusion protein)
MKIWKFLLVTIVLGTAVAALAGCNATPAETTAGSTVATVARGNVSVDITAAGNLALSHTEDLAVDLFYPAGTKGTIGEVLVQEGDSVTAGEVLVTIDRSEWDEQLTTLEEQVTTQQRNLLQAQINAKNSEQSLKNAQDTITSRETAILTSRLTLQAAQNTLSGTISAIDDQVVIAEYNKARTWYEYATTTLGFSGITSEEWELAKERAAQQLNTARIAYDNMLSGYNNLEAQTKKQQVEIARRNLDAAETDLEDARISVSLAEDSLTLVRWRLEDAEKALDDARASLSDARGKSPEITAPFDCFVTSVAVAGGDEVLNGTVAVTIADPASFEADILVSEIDIMQVQTGGRATIQADALPGMVFPAEVTHISPTATIQSGVVNYNVKVEVSNARSANVTAPADLPDFSAAPGELPAPLQQAVDSGRLTQAQAEEIAQRMQSGDFQFPGNGFPGQGGGFSQLPASVSAADGELRDGLTVTVTIMVARATDVLVVPNAAVTTRAGRSTVEVIKADGTTEPRQVETGLSDWQYTEITSGLTEGEQVNVPRAAAPATNDGPGGIFFGGPR